MDPILALARDAGVPVIEVHLSNIFAREPEAGPGLAGRVDAERGAWLQTTERDLVDLRSNGSGDRDE